jgi:hypothetical protein
MSDMGFTPNLIAGAGTYGTINPFRFVHLDTAAAFSGLSGAATAAAASQTTAVGVTDGSVYLFNQTAHAIPTTAVSLQPSNTVQIEAGAAIATAGVFLMSDASGRAITHAAVGTTNIATSCYVALESAAAAGEIIRAYRFGTRTIIS